MPTNMFRGFENAGDDEGLIFVVLGNDDPGIITWVPQVLLRAKETGLALLNDNSLIDLTKNEIPNNKKLLKPITDNQLKEFDNYNLNQIEKFVCRFENQPKFENDLKNGIKLLQIIGSQFCNKKYVPLINQNTGFNLSILKAKTGQINDLIFDKPTIIFSQKGLWKITINKDEFIIKSKDTFSVPLNTKLNISIEDNEEGYLNCVSKI